MNMVGAKGVIEGLSPPKMIFTPKYLQNAWLSPRKFLLTFVLVILLTPQQLHE